MCRNLFLNRSGKRCGAGHGGSRWGPLRGGTRWIALGSAARRDTMEHAGKAKESLGKLAQAPEKLGKFGKTWVQIKLIYEFPKIDLYPCLSLKCLI